MMLALIGFTIGDWFAGIDYAYQQSKAFLEMSATDKLLAKAFLDAFHHWQIGAILFFLPTLGSISFPGWNVTINFGGVVFTALKWIGVGIWAHDWRDWQHVIDRYKKALTGDEDPEPPGE